MPVKMPGAATVSTVALSTSLSLASALPVATRVPSSCTEADSFSATGTSLAPVMVTVSALGELANPSVAA